MHIANLSDASLAVYRLDYNGNESRYHTLAPGESVEQQSVGRIGVPAQPARTARLVTLWTAPAGARVVSDEFRYQFQQLDGGPDRGLLGLPG